VGWYYMFEEVRPDQIEYVCAKTIGLDGSISIETSEKALEKHPRARQMMEMIGEYEQCRLARHFPEKVRAKLRETGKDFKLFRDGQGWRLYRAAYEEPRFVDALDGRQNAWVIRNDRPSDLPAPQASRQAGCLLGVEIACGSRTAPTTDYEDPKALTIESFDDAKPYRLSEWNRYEKFVSGDGKVLSDSGPVRAGVTQTFRTSEDARVGGRCLVYAAENKGDHGGWGGIGRRFPKPLDLSGHKALALYIHGDGKGEIIRFQLWDAAGRHANWLPRINFTGWRLCVFPMTDISGFDWSKTEYLLFYFNNIFTKSSVEVRFDDLRALPTLRPMPLLVNPAVDINGQRITFPLRLDRGQAVTCQGPGGVTFWPGGMKPGQPLSLSTTALSLKPGENKVLFSADTPDGFPGDVNVLLYRLWPLEE